MKNKSLQDINENSRLYAKGYTFHLSEDQVEGGIRPVRVRIEPIELSDIAEILQRANIQYGIIDSSLLAKRLADNARPREWWTIAKGKPPIPAEKATIVYHFETDPLKIGTLLETGFMDYKDRGKIPQVTKGSLIAEKIPGKKGKSGIDVFGEPVAPSKPPAVRLRCGKGVALSEDGLKAFATTDGRPVKSADGKVHVFTDLTIEGDLGIRTGHVDFEGHIEVAGIVSPGYKVKGYSLCTREINTAHGDIVGNINVLGGISGARLKAGGNLRAGYIHQSVIEVMGDVIVDRDVSNATIIAGGQVIVDNGKILTSTVQAKNGITASGIGSRVSEPCELIVGIDSRIDEAFKEIDLQMSEMEKRRLEMETSYGERDQESRKLQQTIASAKKIEAVTRKKRSQLAEKLRSLRTGKGTESEPWKIRSKIDTLRSASERSLATISKVNKDYRRLLEKMARLREEIEGVEGEITRFEGVLQELDDVSRIREGIFERNPIVETLGTIHAGTTIRGPHASLVVRESCSQVKIVEIKSENNDDPKRWRMTVMPG